MKTRIKVSGIKNPVHAALLYFRGIDVEVDEKSFIALEKIIGDIDLKKGFIVENFKDLNRLCKIGKFQIWFEKGAIIARKNPTKLIIKKE